MRGYWRIGYCLVAGSVPYTHTRARPLHYDLCILSLNNRGVDHEFERYIILYLWFNVQSEKAAHHALMSGRSRSGNSRLSAAVCPLFWTTTSVLSCIPFSSVFTSRCNFIGTSEVQDTFNIKRRGRLACISLASRR